MFLYVLYRGYLGGIVMGFLGKSRPKFQGNLASFVIPKNSFMRMRKSKRPLGPESQGSMLDLAEMPERPIFAL